MEKVPSQEHKENEEQLLSTIDELSRDGRNDEALEMTERLPEGEEKYYRIAYIGQNYVEAGELEKAQRLVDALSEHEESLAYAGGVLELILRKTGEIEQESLTLSEEIETMFNADQKMRERALSDPDFWDYTVDQKNTQRMKEIVRQIGWPTISKVGTKASEDAWLLVQHADHDIEFQKECLALMKNEPVEDVKQQNVAYLEDRIRVNSKASQLYGTQYREEGGVLTPLDIEDPDTVDERRARMGLGTLEEGTREMYIKYKMKDPREI